MTTKIKRDRKAYHQEWYRKNRERHKAAMQATRDAVRAQWTQFKSALECTKCGEKHPATLDFHHVVPSKHKVHRLISAGQYDKAMEEVKKCVVLCSNCHRKVHHDERQVQKTRQVLDKQAKTPNIRIRTNAEELHNGHETSTEDHVQG